MLEQIIKNLEQRDFFEKRYDEDSDQDLWFVNTGFIPDNTPIYFEDVELIRATEKMISYLDTCYDLDQSSIGRALRSLGGGLYFCQIIITVKNAVL